MQEEEKRPGVYCSLRIQATREEEKRPGTYCSLCTQATQEEEKQPSTYCSLMHKINLVPRTIRKI